MAIFATEQFTSEYKMSTYSYDITIWYRIFLFLMQYCVSDTAAQCNKLLSRVTGAPSCHVPRGQRMFEGLPRVNLHAPLPYYWVVFSRRQTRQRFQVERTTAADLLVYFRVESIIIPSWGMIEAGREPLGVFDFILPPR